MRLSIFRAIRPATLPRIEPAVARDADGLLKLWGSAAMERATELSWREDSGLVASPRAGHWWRVRREIGRRQGLKDVEPLAEFAA